jgi:hypothetical protein
MMPTLDGTISARKDKKNSPTWKDVWSIKNYECIEQNKRRIK